jgi:signal transduction histidine kinase
MPLSAQTELDSLLRRLPAAGQDTASVMLFIGIGQQYEPTQPEISKQYYRKAYNLSRKLGYTTGVIKYIINYTAVLNTQGNYDSSILLNLQGVALSAKIKDTLLQAKCHFNTAVAYLGAGDYEKATLHSLEAKKRFERSGNLLIEAQCDNFLQVLYNRQQLFEKAEASGIKAIAKLRTLEAPDLLAEALINLAVVYKERGLTGKEFPLLQEALSITQETGNINLQSTALLNLGDLYIEERKYELAKPYIEKALPLQREIGATEGEAIALRGLSIYYFQAKQFVTAKSLAEQALQLTRENNQSVQTMKNLLQLSDIAAAMHDMPAFDRYREQADLLQDSIMNESLQKHIAGLEQKYEAERREYKIKQLTREQQLQSLRLHQKNLLNYILAGVAIAVLLLLCLVYRNYRQKQQLQQQRIGELEKEQQLMATEAVLKGEEQERTRLARDLHDGLGGMLSGIKYAFRHVKRGLTMSPESHEAFGRNMDMLDSSIKELRRVAHNMMPESLIKFGLDTALRDFCRDLDQPGRLSIVYQSVHLDEERLDQTTAITVFRIIQELVHNILKHAEARQVMVQIASMDDRISITVEDDGKGFALDTGLNSGIGWTNIKSRTEYLKGKIDLQSAPGQGASVHIEFPYP